MVEKIFDNLKSMNDIINQNPKFPNKKPLIGFCPDWRKKRDENGNFNYFYMITLLNMYKNCIEKAGGLLYIISFEHRAKDIENIIDGYLIPGGRDIDPKNYNEERNLEIHEEAEERFTHLNDIILNLPKKIPILGICFGFEFINVIFGGTLIKEIRNSEAHTKKRKFKIKKGTILNKLVGDVIIGSCYHHQGIKTLGKDLIVNSIDNNDQIIHGLEYNKNGRWILSILWHPEFSYESEKSDLVIENNQKIFNGFIKEVKKRKNNNYSK